MREGGGGNWILGLGVRGARRAREGSMKRGFEEECTGKNQPCSGLRETEREKERSWRSMNVFTVGSKIPVSDSLAIKVYIEIELATWHDQEV